MFHLIAKWCGCAGLMLLVSGCVEVTATITLNPDGKGKVVEEVFMPCMGTLNLLGGAGEKERPLEEMRLEAVVQFVTKTKGVTAWKDVAVTWAQDGRLHMVGTAYFDQMFNIGSGPEEFGSPLPGFQVHVEKDGLKISGKNFGKMELNKKAAPDFAKMTEMELDEHILKLRVGYQTARPFLVMMLTDLKLKMVMRLPGEILEAKGYQKTGATEVSFALDGNELLQATKKFIAQDTVSLKKRLKGGESEILESFGMNPEVMEPMLTARKIGKAQFDFDKEVKEARAAYPELRKQLKLAPETKLPGER